MFEKKKKTLTKRVTNKNKNKKKRIKD